MAGELVESAAEHTEAVTPYKEKRECDGGLEEAASGEKIYEFECIEPSSPPPAPERRHAPIEGPCDIAGRKSKLNGITTMRAFGHCDAP